MVVRVLRAMRRAVTEATPRVRAGRDIPPLVVVEPRTSLRRLGVPDVWEFRHLLWFFVLRTIRGRYRPTVLGRGWILLRPLLLSLVYVLVFGAVLRIRTDPVPFPLYVFAGITIFQFFSGGVMETAASLVSNYSIMSRVYYPRLVVPLTSIVVNAVDLAATCSILALMMAVYRVAPDWRIVLVPAFLLAIGLTTLATGVILAAFSVKVRDILVALPVVMRILIYTMPAVYPVTLIPERFRPFYFLNPMATYLQGFRWALLKDTAPPPWALGLSTVIVVVALVYGLYAFSRVERTMVDVL